MATTAPNLSALARALERPRQIVHRWAQRNEEFQRRWPRPPYPVEAVRAWSRTLREPAAPAAAALGGELAAAGPKTRAQIQYLIERALMVRLEREVKLRQYVPRSEVEAQQVRRVLVVRRRLETLGRSLAPELVGMEDVDAIAERIDAAVQEILAEFAGESGAGQET